ELCPSGFAGHPARTGGAAAGGAAGIGAGPIAQQRRAGPLASDRKRFHFRRRAARYLAPALAGRDHASKRPGHAVAGPEPIIGKQEVVLVSTGLPGRSLRVATDGLRPFAV